MTSNRSVPRAARPSAGRPRQGRPRQETRRPGDAVGSGNRLGRHGRFARALAEGHPLAVRRLAVVVLVALG